MENGNNFCYIPETLEEEYAFMAGRIKALEIILSKIDDYSFDKKLVASILGIEYPESKSAPEV